MERSGEESSIDRRGGRVVSASADGVAAVEAHLAALPEPQRSTLRAVRASLRSILPDAEECLKYRMPAFVVGGKTVAGYDGFKNHCSYFPHSGGVVPRAGAILDRYDADRGTLRFAIDEPLPVDVLRRLVEIRFEEIAEQEALRKSKKARG
ncbi:MAG: iron chaperone [Ilumatobacteraceae bacterium]